MMAKNWKIISITFEINAQKHRNGQFTVPRKVCDLLNLKPHNHIHLDVMDTNERELISDVFQLRSGTEIYGPELRKIIKSGQRIIVTASKP